MNDILRVQITKTFSDIRELEKCFSPLRRTKCCRNHGTHQNHAIYTFLGRGVFYNVLIGHPVKYDLVRIHRDAEDSGDILVIQPLPKHDLVTKPLPSPVSTGSSRK